MKKRRHLFGELYLPYLTCRWSHVDKPGSLLQGDACWQQERGGESGPSLRTGGQAEPQVPRYAAAGQSGNESEFFASIDTVPYILVVPRDP